MTTTDPDTGQPWDLSKPEVQAKVRRKIHEDKPLFMMASPPCTAFCTWMHVNYNNMDKDKVQEVLWNGMRHLAFAVDMCLLQERDGRFYALEHPNGAMSWATGIMQTLLNLKGSQRVAWDFCMLGMKTAGEDLSLIHI